MTMFNYEWKCGELKDKNVVFRMPIAEYEHIRVLSRLNGIKVSDFIRNACELYLRELEGE